MKARAASVLSPAPLALAGGLLFLAIFALRYAGLDPWSYEFRDDGVITLSHARNWIDFGFIGINPSGERVEATSAPLQFLLYALAYLVTGVGYERFMTVQTIVCTFAIGALFTRPFAHRPRFALLATGTAALVLTQLPDFLLWQASGMENALTHAFLLATVVLLAVATERGRLPLWSVMVPFLASIVRVDGVYHVAPLLALFCVWWHWKHGDSRALRFAAAFALAWLAFNALRYAYFGAFMPQTAAAQGISVGDRLLRLLRLSPTYLDQSFSLMRILVAAHGVAWLAVAIPFLLVRRPRESQVLLMLLAGSVIASCLFAPFVFGEARLAVARTTTQAALLVTLFVAAAAGQAQATRRELYGAGLVGAGVFFLAVQYRSTPGAVCCSAHDFGEGRRFIAQLAAREGIARPTLANPDLGDMSWHKQFNVLDLGLLGSPLLAHLPRGPARDEYLLDYAAPDIVETHGFWTCRYESMLADPRFAARYVQLRGHEGEELHSCSGRPPVPTGIWMRKDVLRGAGTRERALIDDLQRKPSVDRLAAEMRVCGAAGGSPLRCAYVARSAYRVLPELRAQGAQARLEALFATSPSADFDLHLMRGALDAQAYRIAVTHLLSDPR